MLAQLFDDELWVYEHARRYFLQESRCDYLFSSLLLELDGFSSDLRQPSRGILPSLRLDGKLATLNDDAQLADHMLIASHDPAF